MVVQEFRAVDQIPLLWKLLCGLESMAQDLGLSPG